jgi:hypothetical protein
MSANSSLAIRIAAIFDGKGLKQAEKGVKGLQSSVKKLAGAAGIGLTAAAVVKFGKNAAKAFVQDQKAVTQLTQSVKNLGLAFDLPSINGFVDKLSLTAGVADDQLRPAMQKLLQVTGSTVKSQELMIQALDISRGSGIAYETVIQDLANAYVGNTKGLKKYNLGLTTAELKTLKFTDAQEKLTETFKGSSAAYLGTYAGKMELLGVAAGEATETIGKGLIDALMILTGDTSVQELADTMQDFADNTAEASSKFATFVKGLLDSGVSQKAQSTWSWLFTKREYPWSPVQPEYKYNDKVPRPRARRFFMGGQDSIQFAKDEAARKKADAEALKRQKELAAFQTKQLADAKKKAALEKAGRTLELQRINLTAALKGKISETDKLSLQLQIALLDQNDTLAAQLSAKLEAATKANAQLQKDLLATPKAPNPFSEWAIPKLDFGGNLLGSAVPNFVPPSWMTPEFMAGIKGGTGPQAYQPPVVEVEVKIGSEDVAAIITQQQTNQSLSGSFVNVNRLGRFGNRSVAE